MSVKVRRYKVDGNYNTVAFKCSGGAEVEVIMRNRRLWGDDALKEAVELLCFAVQRALANALLNLRLATFSDKIILHVRTKAAVEYNANQGREHLAEPGTV